MLRMSQLARNRPRPSALSARRRQRSLREAAADPGHNGEALERSCQIISRMRQKRLPMGEVRTWNVSAANFWPTAVSGGSEA